MDAAFMSLEQHGCGIHVVRSGAGGAKVTKVRSRVRMLVVRAVRSGADGAGGAGGGAADDSPHQTGVSTVKISSVTIWY
jgi:hypothetical protein